MGIRPSGRVSVRPMFVDMGWRDHLLRLLVRGILLPSGQDLDTERAIRVLERIDGDPELLARLNGESEEQVRNTFLELYWEERPR